MRDFIISMLLVVDAAIVILSETAAAVWGHSQQRLSSRPRRRRGRFRVDLSSELPCWSFGGEQAAVFDVAPPVARLADDVQEDSATNEFVGLHDVLLKEV